jgi:hypothetical protein
LGSVLLHLPITPLGALFGLIGLLSLNRPEDAGPALPPITEIPVDLFSDEPAGTAAPAAPPEPAAPAPDVTPELPKPRPKPPPKPPSSELDAGVVDAGVPDASVSDAGVPDAGGALADAGAGDGGVDAGTDAGAGPGISDPVAVSGAARSVADPNANVKILIDTEKLRAHPLGSRVGTLLSGVHQWRDFMGPSGIDPVRDIDRILIVGPQLRNSSDVVAVVQHRLGRERMRKALDLLVQRDPEGKWLDSKVPVASARADRAPRFFVLPSARLVVVTPESTLESAKRLPAKGSLPALPGAAMVTAYVKTPWRAVRGLPLRVPRSIAWVRARIEPLSAGGALIDFEAQDENEELARSDAEELTRAVTAATELRLGPLGDLIGLGTRRFVESVSFEADGSKIRGRITVTANQVLTLLDFAGAMFVPPAAPKRRSLEDAGSP